MTYYLRSLEIKERVGDNLLIINSLRNIGNTYLEFNNYEKALLFYKRTLDMGYKIGSRDAIYNSFYNLGRVSYNMGNYSESLQYFKKSIELAKEIGDSLGLGRGLVWVGDIHAKNQRYEQAERLILNGLKIFKRKNDLDMVSFALLNLMSLYERKGDYRKAFEVQSDQIKVVDSLQSISVQVKVSELKTQYEIEKKDKEIRIKEIQLERNTTEIKRQQVIIITFILGLIVLLIAILFFYKQIKYKEFKKRVALKGEVNKYMHQALSQQMNPHFIFNVLNSIQSYIYKNDKFTSSEYLSKFAKLMRQILNNSQHEIISIRKDLDALRLYLDLELLRFENRFDYSFEIDEKIDLDYYKIPPLLIQPLVENAILHGVTPKKKGGKIIIKMELIEDDIICIIEDNGIGRIKSSENKQNYSHGESHGIAITEKRLKAVTEYFEREMHIRYIDFQKEVDGKEGTRVEINIPLMN